MSLFAHLAFQFGSHPENLATEALAHVLRRSATARAALRDLLRGLGSNLDDELTYATQAAEADAGRPDLIGRSANGAAPLVVEVKFWAELTAMQPVGYLGRLPSGGTLMFVGPAARAALLWGELRRRCVDASLPFVEEARGGALVAASGEQRIVSLSWRHVLATLRAQLEATGERAVVEDVAQLEGLYDRMDAEAFLPVTSEELTSRVVRRVHEFGEIADELALALVTRGSAAKQRARPSGGNGWFGRYVDLHGVGSYLGYFTKKWSTFAPTPLWLILYGSNWTKSDPRLAHRALAPLEAQRPGTVFEHVDGFPTVALFVPTGVERDAIVRRVVEQVEAVAALVAPLGLVPRDSDAEPPSEP